MKNKILIWGTGKIAKTVYAHGLNGKVIGFIETYQNCGECEGLPVYQANKDALPDYDYIVVANSHVIEIFNFIKKRNMDMTKIIFFCFCPMSIYDNNIEVAENVLGYENFQRYCMEYKLYEKSFYSNDKKKYSELNKREQFKIQKDFLWPIIGDRFGNAGTINNYFTQDLWAAKLIYKNKPRIHYDIGSRLDGFIAHILAMGIPVKMIDIRPFPMEIEGLNTVVDDATYLKQFDDNSVESLSALCSLEHFGLGRYGDPIDPEACFKCFTSIQKKVKYGGNVYISVPVGKERLEFNAHRIFYANTIVKSFSELDLVEFSCAVDGKLEKNVDLHRFDNDMHNGEYCYGLFHFVK